MPGLSFEGISRIVDAPMCLATQLPPRRHPRLGWLPEVDVLEMCWFCGKPRTEGSQYEYRVEGPVVDRIVTEHIPQCARCHRRVAVVSVLAGCARLAAWVVTWIGIVRLVIPLFGSSSLHAGTVALSVGLFAAGFCLLIFRRLMLSALDRIYDVAVLHPKFQRHRP